MLPKKGGGPDRGDQSEAVGGPSSVEAGPGVAVHRDTAGRAPQATGAIKGGSAARSHVYALPIPSPSKPQLEATSKDPPTAMGLLCNLNKRPLLFKGLHCGSCS